MIMQENLSKRSNQVHFIFLQDSFSRAMACQPGLWGPAPIPGNYL